MSFSIGIVGLPNVGKSTLFKALTKNKVDIASYPFTTIDPNVGIVEVPDLRLEKIAEIIKPEKVTPTIIEFVDIAGLVKGAHKGEGLGNQFLAKVRECDAILEIVRSFQKEDVEHVEKTVDPKRDIEIIRTELIMKDVETAEKALAKFEKDARSLDKEAVKKSTLIKQIKEGLNQEKKITELTLLPEESLLIKEFQFLTQKPTIYLKNSDQEKTTEENTKELTMNLKLEEEISELSEKDAQELDMKTQLDLLIKACYNTLYLITFYTITGGKEVRAWTVKKGAKCPEAGGCVHSDFQEKFIRAEVINWKTLTEAGSWQKARESGQLKTVGHDYQVQDGDVIEFKI